MVKLIYSSVPAYTKDSIESEIFSICNKISTPREVSVQYVHGMFVSAQIVFNRGEFDEDIVPELENTLNQLPYVDKIETSRSSSMAGDFLHFRIYLTTAVQSSIDQQLRGVDVFGFISSDDDRFTKIFNVLYRSGYVPKHTYTKDRGYVGDCITIRSDSRTLDDSTVGLIQSVADVDIYIISVTKSKVGGYLIKLQFKP